jgi:hypothetical protein
VQGGDADNILDAWQVDSVRLSRIVIHILFFFFGFLVIRVIRVERLIAVKAASGFCTDATVNFTGELDATVYGCSEGSTALRVDRVAVLKEWAEPAKEGMTDGAF